MYNLSDKEKEILAFWEKEDIFQKSLKQREKRKHFVFYEGPPTANGRPGLHHVLARAYKDIILRFKTMQGFFIGRKAGWDTHGLPVELEVEKQLGINSKKEIEEYGVGAFTRKAKESVWKYKKEWEEMTKRMGFWLDLEHPYITYETSYIESLWYIIQSFAHKGLLEEDFKVVPWCSRCGTPLSSHELAQGYQKTDDLAITVKFKVQSSKFKVITQNSKVYVLAWTTTPWTLPGNVALAVGDDITYVLIKNREIDEYYILAKDCLGIVKSNYDVVQEFSGKELAGLTYEPLFMISELQHDHAYRIYAADFVNTREGTGVVHTAVMYGEDDYRLGKQVGLPMFHTVTPEGKFIESLPEGLGGLSVKSKEAQEKIENHLQQRGLLFAKEDYTHDYPFCWRCKTPLLYYATKSWFVRVTKRKKELIANNQTINWYPEYLKNGRFGNFLEEVRDWAFSRERFWGTPLPIWKCEHCTRQEVVGSLAELSRASKARNIFIVARHAQSQNNLRRILSSAPEQMLYGLTQKGKEQAECLGESLKNEHIDLIVASPLLRTQQTAKIISELTGTPIQTDDRLREVDFGPFNGREFKEYEEWWGDRHERFTKNVPEGMENFHMVKQRIMQAVQELNKAHQGKTIVLVTHRGPLWVLEGTLRGFSESEIADSFPEDFESGEARKLFVTFPFNDEGDIDLHRPFIDDIEFLCSECKGKMARVPEVADVWFDSGSMPFAQAHWPFDTGKSLKNVPFPADYISEAIDQTRGWFYTLLVVSTMLGFGAPYKNVISLGHLLDEKGRKMSKSLGNIIDPFKAIEQYGVDAIRWYFYVVNPPGFYKRFDPKEILSHQRRFLFTLFNSANFLTLFTPHNKEKVKARIASLEKAPPYSLLDKWVFSRLHHTIAGVTKALEGYQVTDAARLLEEFVDDLSNWYIRRSRERLQGKEADEVIAVLYSLLHSLTKLIAPFVPFSADILLRHYLLPLELSVQKESIHLEDWPKGKKNFMNAKLEEQMATTRQMTMLLLAQRSANKIKTRQPLREAAIAKPLPAQLINLMRAEVNVGNIKVDTTLERGVWLNTTLDAPLLEEGFLREFIRQVQDIRKSIGLHPGQSVSLFISAPPKVAPLLKKHQSSLQKRLTATFSWGSPRTDVGENRRLNFGDKEVTITVDSNNAEKLPHS